MTYKFWFVLLLAVAAVAPSNAAPTVGTETRAPAGTSAYDLAFGKSVPVEAPQVGAEPVAPRPEDSDTPPPSAYDVERRMAGEPPAEVERTLLGQLLRTVVALLLVVALIYLVLKVGLPRVFRTAVAGFGGSGKVLRVVERVQLDAKHGLFLVEVGPQQERLLIGTGGEHGVKLVWSAGRPSEGMSSQERATFRSALEEAGNRDKQQS